MNSIRNSSTFAMLIFALLILSAGCKSKKKAMEANAAAEKARVEREAADQRQKEAALKKQREADEAAAESKRRAEEAKASEPRAKLNQYFRSISNSPNTPAANNSIDEALSMFASAETPVLIVISESGGQKDYDKPTTIKAYLNYLKDQKKNINEISDLKFDNSGKITELELRKNQR